MLTKSEKFYFDGYGIGSFSEGENLDNINRSIDDIFTGRGNSGFFLEQKYPFSKDLRPTVYGYDESFIDILFESDLPNKFKETLGYDLFLAHIQCREVSSKTSNSYMQWHRDTHYYGKKLAGNAPPVHKVIFYPSVNGVTEPCLQIARGSHLRMSTDMKKDFSQLYHSEIDTIASSNNKFVFFNTSLLHFPIIPSIGRGNIRVVYSFCHEFQLKKYPHQKELHEIYKQKMINYRRGDK